MHAAGVNPIDCYIRCGQTMPPPLPYTPGFDGAGIIEEVGSHASNFKVLQNWLLNNIVFLTHF